MVMYIMIAASVLIGLGNAIYFAFVVNKKLKLSERLKMTCTTFLEFTAMSLIVSLFTFLILMLLVGTFTTDTIASSEKIALVQNGQSPVLVVSTGVDRMSNVGFTLSGEGQKDITVANVSIFTDVQANGAYVEKIENRRIISWFAPFPLGGNTHYDIHVAPNQVAGPYLNTVK